MHKAFLVRLNVHDSTTYLYRILTQTADSAETCISWRIGYSVGITLPTDLDSDLLGLHKDIYSYDDNAVSLSSQTAVTINSQAYEMEVLAETSGEDVDICLRKLNATRKVLVA